MQRTGLILLLTTTWFSGSLARAQDAESMRAIYSALPPREPAVALESFQLSPGFRLELVCAEPLVRDPIAIDWDPAGRLWVVEMGGYPQGESGQSNATGGSDDAVGRDPALATGAVGGGRICCLEDTDRDGRYDTSNVFLDGLAFPTSVMVWGKGVLVTCAPELFYAEDTDGDGRADRLETLLTGFAPGNPQHRVNSLRWGLDNWVYGANGDSGGIVESVKTRQRVDIHGRDFRFHLASGALETQTGMAQYGRCRDDWGNWFGGRNLQPLWHCVLDDQYLRRNPFLVPPDPCVDLMQPPTCPPVFPISKPLPRFNELWTLNRFTAACGICVYRDELFGPASRRTVFVCEPAYNLVYRGVLQREGVTFRCERTEAEQQSEFLASTDHWFRPVQARTGPDGALWVVDMYRLIIEHPDYIPEKWHQELDFPAGRDRGRIYRVVSTQHAPRRMSALAELSPLQLVQQLASPNGVCRDMAQRLLVDAQDRRTVQPLRQFVLSGASPQSRLSALGALDGLAGVDGPLLRWLLRDPHPALRRHAVRLAPAAFADDPEVAELLGQLVADPDPQVRLQLAYALGEWDDPRGGLALARIAIADAGDPLVIAAVMSSATRQPAPLLQQMLAARAPSDEQVALLQNLLRLVLEAERYDALVIGLRKIATRGPQRFCAWQYALLAALADALENSGETYGQFRDRSPAALQQAIDETAAVFEQAAKDVENPSLPAALRVQAVRLMGRDPRGRHVDPSLLAGLLTPLEPVVVQVAAVDALARLEPAELPAIALDQWAQHGPEVRTRIVSVLLQREDWSMQLLESVQAGHVSANELGLANRNQLILHSNAQIRRLASQLFSSTPPEQRAEVLQRFRGLLSQPASADAGRPVFQKHCASCHQLEGEGKNIGPDLLALTDRSADSLLVAILDPDRAVEPRYVEYSALTERGHILAGMISRETGNSLTLVNAQAAEHQLVRADVVELLSTGKSLMPVGMEQLLASDQELLDLIAYVQSIEPDPALKRPVPTGAE